MAFALSPAAFSLPPMMLKAAFTHVYMPCGVFWNSSD
jgi:hypothetical protein